MKIGDKAKLENGATVVILTDEIETKDLAVNNRGDMFVENGDIAMETVVVRRVRFLDGPKKGDELVVKTSEIIS